MKAIVIVGGTQQPETLLTDLLHWHGLSVFQVDSGDTLLPLLSFISPELVIIESAAHIDVRDVCDRIKHSAVVGHVPVVVCTQQPIAPVHRSADVYLAAPYTAEDVFAYVQALRPLHQSLGNQTIVPSARIDS